MISPPRLNHGYLFQISTAMSLVPVSDIYYDLSLAPPQFWQHVRSDGGDIRIFDRLGIPCPRQVTGFDKVGNKGSLYLKVGNGAPYSIAYGNTSLLEPSPSDPLGSYHVWEASAKGIYHLEDQYDSTSNQHNGTLSVPPPSSVTAKIKDGYEWPSDSLHEEFINMGDVPDFNFTSGFTLHCWCYILSDAGFAPVDSALMSKITDVSYLGYMMWKKQVTSNIQLYINSSSRIASPNLPALAWHHLVATWDGTTLNFYTNSVPATPVSYGVAPASSGRPFQIGQYLTAGLAYTILDEVRVYSRALSSAEVGVMFSNQDNPASFWITGPEMLS